MMWPGIVLYLSSTSNHNHALTTNHLIILSYISLLHQTTTVGRSPRLLSPLSYISLLHQTTTTCRAHQTVPPLSYISLLHQTTTAQLVAIQTTKLSYISLLHQTTTVDGLYYYCSYCLISLFYIKPQRYNPAKRTCKIVLYLSSTSNHNTPFFKAFTQGIVLYLSSTSNHNHNNAKSNHNQIVLYLSSTSNHNVYFISCLFTSICYTSLIHEVVEIVFLLCKNTKKILIAMGLA